MAAPCWPGGTCPPSLRPTSIAASSQQTGFLAVSWKPSCRRRNKISRALQTRRNLICSKAAKENCQTAETKNAWRRTGTSLSPGRRRRRRRRICRRKRGKKKTFQATDDEETTAAKEEKKKRRRREEEEALKGLGQLSRG